MRLKTSKSFFLIALTALTFLFAGEASAQKATPTPPAVDDNDVVKISSTLIRLDAVVTDKNGKQVTDLKPEDFEVFENGVKQEITNFSYVSVAPKPAPESKPVSSDKTAVAIPLPNRLKAEQVRRTIALVVDDLGLSFESTARVRDALKKFVDEQMQPEDLVAIIRTGGGIGALQQFTTDKRQLYAAIERIRWNAQGRGGIGAFAPIEGKEVDDNLPDPENDNDSETDAKNVNLDAETNQLRQDIFSVGTLGAINYIIGGMRELPGRKAIILLSDGFRLVTRDEDGKIDSNGRILDALRRLTEMANRASVVVNTIDPRGLQTAGITAQDSASGFSPQELEQQLSNRRSELFDTQEGLTYLAAQTGGRAFINNNDIEGSVVKVLEDQKGYYLLGYQPDSETFDPTKRRFNKLTVRVKRPGLNVRYRSGFFGVTDDEAVNSRAGTSVTVSPQQRLLSALTSPFGESGIGLRLNALFGNDKQNGSFIRSLLHVQAKDLKFTDEADGTKKAVFDVIAWTFGDNGVPVDQINKSYTVTAKGDDFRLLLEKGFVYSVNLPVKKSGAYQLRVALRDAQSEKIGAANQFIEVPNLKKNRLTLSSIGLQGMTFEQYQKSLQNQAANAGQNTNEGLDPRSDTALRRFHRGSVLQYGCVIYNARSDAAKHPQLQTQVRLIRDRKILFEGKPALFNPATQFDPERIGFDGAISLPEKLEPGDYVLQIIVRDLLAKGKNALATQWIDLELTN